VNPESQRGFTLVEMIVVIVITGIIGGMVAMFIRAPVRGYTDSARRAEMTDIADTALRRISRDIRLALPNSVRVTGTCDGTAAATCFIEFLPTSGGGRYRSGTGGAPGGELDFTQPDSSFEVIGTPPVMVAGDSVVVYNLGMAGADAYAGSNRVAASIAGQIVTFAAPKSFTLDSCQRDPATGDVVGGCRFQVISTPVTYACDPVAGTLTRWQGYAIQPAQPGVLPVGGTAALLANNVSSCIFTYNVSATAERSGLVTMHLTITEQGENVSLYSATHVSNVP
jgi:MSHA biogenesis protein MshO